MLVETVSALGVVLATLLLLRALLRVTGLASGGNAGRGLRVVDSVPLSSKQRLHVVDVEGRRLLIGATDGSIRLLQDLGASEATEPAAAVAESESEPGATSRKPKRWLHALGRVALIAGALLVAADTAQAQSAGSIALSLDGLGEPERLSSTLQIVGLLTVFSMAPALLLMTTCFTRILVVLTLLRQATGLHQLPPNQVLVGLSLFTTFFVMQPLGAQIYEEAITPYIEQKIDETTAFERMATPMRKFLLHHTRDGDLELFVSLSGEAAPAGPDEVSFRTLLPAFMISELRTAFEFGFMIYLPFLVIDVVIASMLISMGMIVLPPMMISLPFKLMLFVLIDGWNLVLRSLVSSIV